MVGVGRGMRKLEGADVKGRNTIIVSVERTGDAVLVCGGGIEGDARVNAGRVSQQMKIGRGDVSELGVEMDVADASSEAGVVNLIDDAVVAEARRGPGSGRQVNAAG